MMLSGVRLFGHYFAHAFITNLETSIALRRRDAKEQGFHDNLFLELETYHTPPPTSSSSSSTSRLHQAIIQELSAANIFLVLNTGEIVTPTLKRGTILPGECLKKFVLHFQINFILTGAYNHRCIDCY